MLPNLEAPELVFGLCSPIGTKNSKFVNLLQTTLLKYRYESKYFKVTDLMKSIKIKDIKLKDSPIEDRYDTHIKYANKIRELTKLDGALAILCCTAVRHFRRGTTEKKYLESHAYIFDQFKREEEISVLRQTYGKLFVLISLHSDRDTRVSYLSHRISSDHTSSRPTTDHERSAKDLVRRDENEQGQPHGQKLADAFALADLFINIDNMDEAEKTLSRFLDAFFGSNKVSPTKDEYGMYLAKTAALRSLDLSRQVGAAIFSDRGEVLSLGCNEVPKAGGGTYWSFDQADARDYTLDGDENERIKRTLLADVVRRLSDGGLMKDGKDVDELVNLVISESLRKGSKIRDAQLMDLLEFGRIIHAEMSAISDAARLGLSVKNSTLYCTTFPCHICAKHIVAAGIMKVMYIEPYPKSYAEQLHSDSISVKSLSEEGKKVHFAPFIGVSPFRFRDIFERSRRKDAKGTFSEWSEGSARPYVKYTVATYLDSEAAVAAILEKKLKELKDAGTIDVI